MSNTDDHLRNHGFILNNDGWRLAPAFDINPSTNKDGLALNIDMDSNALDIQLAKSVEEYFRLGQNEMNNIIDEVHSIVADWKKLATEIGISRSEQALMAPTFSEIST
ncbi:HipA domain-containing protein [Solitalea lacus]|uniref:HipA domain-containing protein n=1 Tax=Solitalea lacus TaxID=2911172 RepID=UPI002107A303|nr:HipA domain-containing protein [Solitalea lacus]